MNLLNTVSALTIIIVLIISSVLQQEVRALGSGSTVAVTSGTATVCAIVAAQTQQSIVCYKPSDGISTNVYPNVSFSTIAAGDGFFCGIRSGGFSLLCWKDSDFVPKRIYLNYHVLLQSLSIGDHQVCATVKSTGEVKCWRDFDSVNQFPPENVGFESVSSGFGFSCGVLSRSKEVRCWGNSPLAGRIQSGFNNMTMASIFAGGSHACGLNETGFLICRGSNDYGQLNVPWNSPSNSPMEFSGLALGSTHTCATLRSNGSVMCWGSLVNNGSENVPFEFVVSGSTLTCGLTSGNLSVICWGKYSSYQPFSNSPFFRLPLPETLPGPCVDGPCTQCGVYPLSARLCSGPKFICRPCVSDIDADINHQPQPLVPSRPPTSKTLATGLLVFAVIGGIGALSGFWSLIYCLWTGVFFGKMKIHNSVQPTMTRIRSNNSGSNSNNHNSPSSRTIRRQGSRMGSRIPTMRRQRSGTSSKNLEKAEQFLFSELAAATDDFSVENKIGQGSYGIVYRGKLRDGREVAIKRGDNNSQSKRFQEKESAFESEVAFLSRLHHKHLVKLVGYCEEETERLLVYEYMKNGALHDHLHDINNVQKNSSFINSWKIRFKIALDAARGIEYLHNYAVPPIVHRDIKSSNILLDGDWTARVSDFGLSLADSEMDRPMKAAGTVGYIDPEYIVFNILTAKTDVYGLGIVLLEILTGKRAIFRPSEQTEMGETPVSIVDYAVPVITAGELNRILDIRVGHPMGQNETEAVELVAYTARHCVNPEGKDRPHMRDIVNNLGRACFLCDNNHGSISSGTTISIVSD